jgi:hypothetical protein
MRILDENGLGYLWQDLKTRLGAKLDKKDIDKLIKPGVARDYHQGVDFPFDSEVPGSFQKFLDEHINLHIFSGRVQIYITETPSTETLNIYGVHQYVVASEASHLASVRISSRVNIISSVRLCKRIHVIGNFTWIGFYGDAPGQHIAMWDEFAVNHGLGAEFRCTNQTASVHWGNPTNLSLMTYLHLGGEFGHSIYGSLTVGACSQGVMYGSKDTSVTVEGSFIVNGLLTIQKGAVINAALDKENSRGIVVDHRAGYPWSTFASNW